MKTPVLALSLIPLAAVALSGCTDATKSKMFNYGSAARVTCYSGGKLIFDDYSTGRVEDAEHSDGYYFVAQSTQRLVHLSGQCLIDYGAPADASFKPVLMAPRT